MTRSELTAAQALNEIIVVAGPTSRCLEHPAFGQPCFLISTVCG